MSTDESTGPEDLLAPPAPPPTLDAVDAPRRRRWPFRRSPSDRYLAGVAGGEGRRLGIDPFYLRVALVGLTLILAANGGGAFVLPMLGYLMAWLTWPTNDEPSLLRRLGSRSAQQEIGGAVALLIFAVVVIGRPSLIWAGMLLAAAIALLGQRPPATGPALDTTADDDLTTLAASPMTAEDKAATWGRSLRGAVAPRPIRLPPRLPGRPRRSPALWPLTVSLLLAYGVACLLLDRILDAGVDPGVAVNGALLIIGGVILLSGWRGRAMATSLLLVPLAPAWVAFSVADTPRFADAAPPSAPAEGWRDGSTITASRGYGELLVRLSDDDLPEHGAIDLDLGLSAGQIDVWVPKEARLHITGHVGLGQIAVYQEPYWSTDGDPLVDYGLDRTYHALGRECYAATNTGEGLREVANWSGIDVPPDATIDEIADATEAAGYPRPEATTVTVSDYYEESNGLAYDPYGQQVDVDPTTGTYERTEWTYQTNENGGLCLPVAAPTDPLLINIDATIGLGNLKVHRV